MITLEDIVLNTDNFNSIKNIIKEHTNFLRDVTEYLNLLSKSYPEIFRRKPEWRLKTLSSIVRKLNTDNIPKEYLLQEVRNIEDIAGVRLTIATQDLYNETEVLLKEILLSTGNTRLKKRWRTDQNENGYCADHFVVSKNGDDSIKCEIQVRTLTHDLWAVFTHYESYKADEKVEKSRAEEIRNYSKLMDLSDHYAKLIRDRKIQDADEFHKKKSPTVSDYSIITVRILQDTLYNLSTKNAFGKEKFKVAKIDVIKMCEIMRELAAFQVYSISDLHEIIENTVFSEALRDIIEEVNKEYVSEHHMDILDAFKILCTFRITNRIEFLSGEITQSTRRKIRGYISAWKLEMLMNDKIDEKGL